MALLERYLSAVGRHLPAGQEEDILDELRDDIQARLDDRASQLGRPLSVDEEADLLRPFGRPLLMAARYSRQQHLIGPGWFPFYWTTLKIALAVALAVQVALVVLSIATQRPAGHAVGRLFEFPFETAITVFGWVTLIFGGLDLATTRGTFADNWDPRKLPRPRRRGIPRASRVGTAIELVISAVFATWWVALRDSSGIMNLPPVLSLAPAWGAFYLPILFVILASLVAKSIILVRPDWTGFRLVSSVALAAAGILIASLILAAGPLFLPGQASGEAQDLTRIFNSLVRWGIAVGVAISIVTTGADVWRWLRRRGR